MRDEYRRTHFPRENRNSVLDKRENIQGVPGTEHPQLSPQDENCSSVLDGAQCIMGKPRAEQKH